MSFSNICGDAVRYNDEHNHFTLITEVKHHRARIVLGWGTIWEP